MSLPNQANDQENYTDANGVAKYADPLSLYKNPEPNNLQEPNAPESTVRTNPTLDTPPLSELPQYTPENPLHPNNVSLTPAQPSAFAIPHFVDLSIVPKDSYCYRESVPFLGQKSTAAVETDAFETVTYDPICNTSEELWRYFLTYLTKPRLILELEVEHYEWRTVVTTNGIKRERRRMYDLRVKLDFSGYVRPDYDWKFLVASDSSKPPLPISFQAALDDYCNLQSSLKEITLQKQINWDLIAFENAMRSLVRNHPSWQSTGHSHTYTAKFHLQNHLVTARSPSKISSLSHKTWMKFLCVISCLWIFVWPLYCLLRKRSKNKLMAMWEGARPWQEAYNKNCEVVDNLVIRRYRSNVAVNAV